MFIVIKHRRKSFRSSGGTTAADYKSTILADNPLFYYRLGESSGTTAYDEVAASSNGNYFNTPTLAQAGNISGDTDTSVLFEQANSEYAETLTLSSETSLLPCTIECFIKLSGASDNTAGIVFYRNINTNASGLNIRGTTLGKLGYHWRGASNTYGYTGGPTLSDNTWYYVALVVESTKATFYVIEEDGTLTTAVNTVSHSALDCSGDGWHIALDPGYVRYFQGYLDEVAIYDQALSQSTLVAHAAAAGFTTLVPNVITSANSSTLTTTIDCSSVTEGYLMIILVTLWASRDITSYPSSWNLERSGKEGTSSGQNQLYAFSKIAAATETTYDFTVDGNLYGARFSYSLLEIPSTGLEVMQSDYSTGAVLGPLYGFATNSLHLALCGKADSSATEDVIHPSGYTEIVDRTGSLHNHAIAYKEISAGGSTSSGSDEFTDPDNTNTTGDNNLSTIHLSVAAAGSALSVHPTAGMTLDHTYSTIGSAYGGLDSATAASAKVTCNFDKSDTGIIMEHGGTGDGLMLYIYNETLYFQCGEGATAGSDSDTGEVSYVLTNSTAQDFIIEWSANTSGCALYVDKVYVGRDSFSASSICGGNDGTIGTGYSAVCVNRGSYPASNTFTGTVTSAEIFLGEVTYHV